MGDFLVGAVRGSHHVWDEGEGPWCSCCTYDHIIVRAGDLSLFSVSIALSLAGP